MKKLFFLLSVTFLALGCGNSQQTFKNLTTTQKLAVLATTSNNVLWPVQITTVGYTGIYADAASLVAEVAKNGITGSCIFVNGKNINPDGFAPCLPLDGIELGHLVSPTPTPAPIVSVVPIRTPTPILVTKPVPTVNPPVTVPTNSGTSVFFPITHRRTPGTMLPQPQPAPQPVPQPAPQPQPVPQPQPAPQPPQPVTPPSTGNYTTVGGHPSCKGFSSTIFIDGRGKQGRFLTERHGGFDGSRALVVAFTTPSSGSYSIASAEFRDGPFRRSAKVSTTPCDFESAVSSIDPSFSFAVAPSTTRFRQTLQPNTTYYFNLENPQGCSNYGAPTTCNMLVEWHFPGLPSIDEYNNTICLTNTDGSLSCRPGTN